MDIDCADFFTCDKIAPRIFKDDMPTMEFPFFSLKTQKDMDIWRWQNDDGTKRLEILPSTYGRATQHDKDVLIYIISQLVSGRKQGQALSKIIRFVPHDFLVATNRQTSGEAYKDFWETLDRLRGTIIKSSFKIGRRTIKEGNGFILHWRTIQDKNDKIISTEIMLPSWLLGIVESNNILTIDSEYFNLRGSLERKLYELARKHVGRNLCWSIGIDKLRQKSGSQASPKNFRETLNAVIKKGVIPGFYISTRQGKNGTKTIVDFKQK